MSIKCVIFDWGDTLANSSEAVKKTRLAFPYARVLKNKGFNFPKTRMEKAMEEMREKTKNIPFHLKTKHKLVYANAFLKALGIKPSKKLASACENSFIEEKQKHTRLLPGARQTLDFLKSKGIIPCAITNSRNELNRKTAKKLGIRKYFRHFIMSHEFGSIKSELKIFHALLKKLNKGRKEKIKASECLMVGDNVLEDGAAMRVGMKVAILKPTMHKGEHLERVKPDYLINSLSEIRKIVKEG